MKQLFLLPVCLLLIFAAKAQNLFPTTGDAGIGTSTPTAGLHIALPSISNRDAGPFQFLMTNSTTAFRFAVVHDVSATRLAMYGPTGVKSTIEATDIAMKIESPSLALSSGANQNLWFDAGYHVFNIGGVEKARISAAGFGIGTSTPAALLHVSPATQYSAIDAAPAFLIANSELTSANIAMGLNGASYSSNMIQSRSGTNASWPISINPYGGSVSIGSIGANAYSKLDVAGVIRSEKAFYLDRAAGNLSTYSYMISREATEASNFGNPLGNGATEVGDIGMAGLILGSQSGNIAFGRGNAISGRIFSNGNWWLGASPADAGYKLDVNGTAHFNDFVGIGTSVNPAPSDAQLKLAVKGNIYAQKLKITAVGWADYVFDKEYKLPTLQEVEAYINEHKHLPGIPSAKDVANDGIDLGDNQVALLKKIEELTLYVIDLNKKVKELQEQINQKKDK